MTRRGPTREALQEQCTVFPVRNDLRLEHYFQCARELMLQGNMYQEDPMRSYVYYKRFMVLALNEIPKHNAYNKKQYEPEKVHLRRDATQIFPILEALSQELDDIDDVDARSAGGEQHPSGLPTYLHELPEAPTGAPRTVGTPVLQTEPFNSQVPPLSSNRNKHTAGMKGLMPSRTDEFSGQLVGSKGGVPDTGKGARTGTGVGDNPAGWTNSSMSMGEVFNTLQDVKVNTSRNAGSSPLFFHSCHTSTQTPPNVRPLDLKAKRKVVLPSSVVMDFEEIARPNTLLEPDGIETCGILAGRADQDVLRMTTLIIPKQTGSSDQCSTTNEEEMFNYMLTNNLITLGWIHTHPKQDCFLSSVDLHTHCGYQLMLPEAVAIVYAPLDRDKTVGVFHLVDPEGLRLIQACNLKGFHVHPENVRIYEDASKVEWSQSDKVVIADLR
ncbi:unnamed protein product [Discosporangium mesarthrocarpum]